MLTLFTLKQFIRQPIPELPRPVTHCASDTKLGARQPRTFAQVLVWESFCHEARSRFQALDDTIKEYLPQVGYFCWLNLHESVVIQQRQQILVQSDPHMKRSAFAVFRSPIMPCPPIETFLVRYCTVQQISHRCGATSIEFWSPSAIWPRSSD